MMNLQEDAQHPQVPFTTKQGFRESKTLWILHSCKKSLMYALLKLTVLNIKKLNTKEKAQQKT